MANRNKRHQRESKQETQIITLLIASYLMTYCFHAQIIPYLHLTFFPFILLIQCLNFVKAEQHLFLIDFPIFIHVVIAIYILMFLDNQYCFSLCWVLSMGWSAFAIFISDDKIYFDLEHFYSFYVHYSPALIMYIAANHVLYDEPSLKTKKDLIENYLLPQIGLMLASGFFIAWSIINICSIAFACNQYKIKAMLEGKKAKIPFIQMCEKLWPSQLNRIRDYQHFYSVYACYVTFNLAYLGVAGLLSVYLFNHQWVGFLFLLGLFILSAYKGFNMFLNGIDEDIKAAKNKKLS